MSTTLAATSMITSLNTTSPVVSTSKKNRSGSSSDGGISLTKELSTTLHPQTPWISARPLDHELHSRLALCPGTLLLQSPHPVFEACTASQLHASCFVQSSACFYSKCGCGDNSSCIMHSRNVYRL